MDQQDSTLEHSLIEKEKRLRLATEAAGLGVFEWDVVRDISCWENERMYEILERSQDEGPLNRRQFEALLADEDRETFRSKFNDAMQQGCVVRLKVRARLPRGVRHLEISGLLEKNEAGKPVRMIGVMADTTDADAAADEIRRSEERYRLAALAIHGVVYDWDLVSNQIVRSPGLEILIGVPDRDARADASWWTRMIHPEDYARLTKLMAAVYDGSAVEYSCEYRISHAQGHWVKVWDRGYIVRDAAGKAARLVGSTSDITERVRGEEELAAQARELQRSNEELQRFAYTASHDLQEPIRTIAILSQMLMRRHGEEIGEQGRGQLAMIIDAGYRMAGLVNSLLEYSKISDGIMHPAAVPMNTVVERTLRLISAAIQESGASIEVEPLPVVLGDEILLTQLCQNLFSNSLKYAKAGEPPRVRLWAERRDGDWVFHVKDHGLGFDPVYAEPIFSMFKRLHAGTLSGAGIGLSTCRKIIERHGGRIWAESGGAGQGATFCFTLPAGLE